MVDSQTDKVSTAGKTLGSPLKPAYPYKSWALVAALVSFLLPVRFLDAWPAKLLLSSGYYLCSDNDNIYTVDNLKPRVACIFVKGSLVVDTGSFKSRKQLYLHPYIPSFLTGIVYRAPEVFRIDPRSIVVPGLADAHAHILEYGLTRQLPLIGTASVQEVIERIKAYILSHPEVLNDKTRWIDGMGWDHTKWDGAQFPTSADLNRDPLLQGRPIALNRIDGHSRWVSPRVLELMGNLPDQVEGGLIIRDTNGHPTGIFVDNAMGLIPIPPWSPDRMSDFFDITMKDALMHGLTSIHDADAYDASTAFYKRMSEEGKLPNRLYLMTRGTSLNDSWPYLTNYGLHGRLNVRSVKLFADGALGSWSAALLEPYSDKPESKGLLVKEPAELAEFINRCWTLRLQVNIHCIGDRANHVVLNILEDVIRRENIDVTTWRPRIEHAQIFTPSDIERMGRLGVIASVQPTYATSDMTYAERRLGPERTKNAYVYQTLLRVSPQHVLPIGSDFPVESVNPLVGFYAAVTRLHPDGSSPHGPDGWYAEQRLTRAQALKGMTLDAAYASFAENEIGSLTPGKKADFVVLNRDIMTVPFEEILGTKVTATVIDGKVLYGSL